MSDESTALVEFNPNDLSGFQKTPIANIQAISGSSYLGRLALCGGSSDLVKRNKINNMHFALIKSKDEFIDLGPSVDGICICARSKAILMVDPVQAVYDETHPFFKELVAKSAIKNSNAAYGPEYLVFIPSVEKFALFHFNSKTARREAENMTTLISKGFTTKGKIFENSEHTWNSQVVFPCSAALKIPPREVVQREVDKFNNPPTVETEAAPAASEQQER